MSVISIARPKSADRWALGRFRRLFRVSTAFLHSRAGVWDQVFAVDGRLDSIGVLEDGSVLAVGESISVLFDGDRWLTMGTGLQGCDRIWGANPRCVNALCEGGLFHHDGRHWEHVDLGAQAIPGRWVDGDCDSRGIGWIVGWSGTFSCMAQGSGQSWRRDGCGAEELWLIHVAPDGHAFAAGSSEVWRYDGTEWFEVLKLNDGVVRSALALSSAGEFPIAVACRFQDLVRADGKGRASLSELDVYTGAGWQTVRMPVPITTSFARTPRVKIDGAARLLIAQGSSIWESAPIVET